MDAKLRQCTTYPTVGHEITRTWHLANLVTHQITSLFLFWFVYLNSLSIDVHDPLSEVHPDGGVGSAGELPGAEAVSEAGLPDPGAPYHDHLKGPAAGRQRRGRAAERV